ncbi:MAG TPA: hypothetical protein VL490_01275 [Mucilaginibacter sp.]|jgi:hypothetical protein|nr:hypothetical protein [Mucilaginibacter sp.]
MSCFDFVYNIDWDLLSKIGNVITALIAFAALYISNKSVQKNMLVSDKNINLSIQQSIFKIIIDKAKDCNNLWINEPIIEKENKYSPHFLVATELIVAIDVIDKACHLFANNSDIINNSQNDYFELYWLQLQPDVRGWVQDILPQISGNFNEVYRNQIKKINNKFSRYFS